ncbi:MAG: hypothetical protein H7252_07010 [Cytophaga sp.]|nr:hypothetical protein [Undibacterium sp.]
MENHESSIQPYKSSALPFLHRTITWLSEASYVVWIPFFFAAVMFATDAPNAPTGLAFVAIAAFIGVGLFLHHVIKKLSRSAYQDGKMQRAYVLAGAPLLVNTAIIGIWLLHK